MIIQVKVQHLSKENADLQSEMTTLQGGMTTLREEKSGLQRDNEIHISEVKRLQVFCVCDICECHIIVQFESSILHCMLHTHRMNLKLNMLVKEIFRPNMKN